MLPVRSQYACHVLNRVSVSTAAKASILQILGIMATKSPPEGRERTRLVLSFLHAFHWEDLSFIFRRSRGG